MDEWPLGTKTVIPQHKSTEERINVAKNFRDIYNWILPMAVDTISNEFHNEFAAWPERAFVVKDGKMAYVAMAGDDGYDQLWSLQILEFLQQQNL